MNAVAIKGLRVALAVIFLALAGCSSAPSAMRKPDAAQLQKNKDIVVNFYNEALNNKNVDAAVGYLGTTYVQHNPFAADGVDGFRQFMTFIKEKFPQNRSEIKRVIAEDDLVVLHIHAVREPGTLGNAIIDIFRVKDGKIVEHWDAVQPVPEKSANRNTMF